jgi:MFS family permease
MLSPLLILLMAVATGVAVANNYYVQPLLDTIANSFKVSHTAAGMLVTTAQLFYGAGLLLLVPLADMVERRRLIVVMMLLATLGLLISALATNLLVTAGNCRCRGLFGGGSGFGAIGSNPSRSITTWPGGRNRNGRAAVRHTAGPSGRRGDFHMDFLASSVLAGRRRNAAYYLIAGACLAGVSI